MAPAAPGAAAGADDADDAAALLPRVVVETDVDLDSVGLDGPGAWRREMGWLLHLSLPLSATSVLSFLSRTITLAQVGALGSLELSAMSLASTLFNITGLSLVMGIGSAAETFFGQAAGMGEHALLGLVLQRASICVAATAVLPLAAWTRAPQLLKLLGQQDDLALLAGRYVQFASPALLLGGLDFVLTLYLAMQGCVRPLTLVSAAVVAATPLANHALINVAGLGLNGAALSGVAIHALQTALLLALAAWQNRAAPRGAKPWAGLSGEALMAIPSYLAVALPATGMMVVDWWALEVLTLLAGTLQNARVAVGACGVLFTINVICFFCVDGVGSAVKIRVARLLGARRPSAARRSLRAGLLLGAAWAALLSAALAAARSPVARLFSSDPEVTATVISLAPWLIANLAISNFSNVISGALRGCGRQKVGFAVNTAAYWGVGVPVAALLALRRGWGVEGLWTGLVSAAAVQLVALAAVMARQDWGGEVERSMRLVRSQSSSAGGAALGAAARRASLLEGDRPGRRSSGGGGGGGGGGGVGAVTPLLEE